MSRLW